MGMFDTIECLYPLPVAGANRRTYQTKDTPSQQCEHYEIREDGTLWYEDNHGWKPEPLTGEVYFYDFYDSIRAKGWIEFKATFADGKLTDLSLVENQEK